MAVIVIELPCRLRQQDVRVRIAQPEAFEPIRDLLRGQTLDVERPANGVAGGVDEDAVVRGLLQFRFFPPAFCELAGSCLRASLVS